MPAPGLANGRSDEGRDSLAAGIVPWPEVFARRYREAGFWEGITLCEMLQRSAARLPGKTAVVDGERRLSYAELLQRVERQAAAFLACGLSPGERVVFQLGNGLDLVVCLLGLARIGVVPVMALPAHRDTEIAHFLRQSKASAYLVPDVVRGFDYREMARRVAPGAPGLRTVLVQGDARAGEVSVRDLAARAPEPALALEGIGPQSGEVALMLLSGGTTGLPKLIPRTHDDYVYTCKASGRIAGFGPDTVFLAVLPMAHNYTLGCPGLLGALAVGGTVVIAPSHDAETVFGLVEAERVTSIGATVPLVARWLASDAERRRDLSSLRVFMNGGAKLPPELRRRVEERLRCRYQENFGTGEGLLSITRLEDSEAIRFESSGRPVSEGDEIRVIDDAGQDVPDGQTGELAVRGPYTVRGYFDAPQINAEAFTPDGFYRMGDIVRRVDGYLYLEGRRKDIINRGGQKVSCEEVENFILAHPRVQSVCVVAMPDPTYGEKACAFVIPREGSTLEFHELTAFLLAQGIAKFKMPERLEIVSDFPISPAGKVLRRELRALIAEKLARESSTA
ncbi:MAG: AMP-binding protein [Burkholderiales bacterium]|nr:AMP-binding protein [Burkholderiales bacterium]